MPGRPADRKWCTGQSPCPERRQTLSIGHNVVRPARLKHRGCRTNYRGKSTCADVAACSRERIWQGRCEHSLYRSEMECPTCCKSLPMRLGMKRKMFSCSCIFESIFCSLSPSIAWPLARASPFAMCPFSIACCRRRGLRLLARLEGFMVQFLRR